MKAYFADGSAGFGGIAARRHRRAVAKGVRSSSRFGPAGVNRFDVDGGRRLSRPAPAEGTARPRWASNAAGEVAFGWPGGSRAGKQATRVMGRCWGRVRRIRGDERRACHAGTERLPWTQAANQNVMVVAYDAVVTNGELKGGEAILVNAASSGIGRRLDADCRLARRGADHRGTTRALGEAGAGGAERWQCRDRRCRGFRPGR